MLQLFSELLFGMNILPVMILSVILLCGLYGLSQAHESRRYLTAEERLYHDLLDGYEDHFVNTRPVSKHNETMKVSVGMSFININSFDESTGVGEFLTWDRNSWTDSRLRWEPDHYDGVSLLRIPVDLIWQPDITDYNSLWSREADHIGDTLAVVDSNGNVLHIPMHVRKVKCIEEEKAIADDEFVCKFKIGSWTYSSNLLLMEFYGQLEKLDVSDFMGDGDHILGNTAVSVMKTYDCCTESYQDITFTLTISDDAV